MAKTRHAQTRISPDHGPCALRNHKRARTFGAPTVFTAGLRRRCARLGPQPLKPSTTPRVARSASAATAMASWWGSTRPKPWRGVLPSNHPKGILRVAGVGIARPDRGPARHVFGLPGHRLGGGDATDAMYVAKNNNALLRYRALRRMNREFHAVVMFRDPLKHAASLLAMHQKYCTMQGDDPFVLEYMNWLAHHEFGLGHKPFNFPRRRSFPRKTPTPRTTGCGVDQPPPGGSGTRQPSPAPRVLRGLLCASPSRASSHRGRDAHGCAHGGVPCLQRSAVDHAASPALLEEARRIHQALLAQQPLHSVTRLNKTTLNGVFEGMNHSVMSVVMMSTSYGPTQTVVIPGGTTCCSPEEGSGQDGSPSPHGNDHAMEATLTNLREAIEVKVWSPHGEPLL